MIGQTLGGRYQVIEVLGAGGFGHTYVAIDQQRPGSPKCALKHLSFSSQDEVMLKQARQMFAREAATLERLGQHDQIPQLLAYFEEQGEFYLVQEFVEGYPFAYEIPEGTALSEAETIELLEQVLPVLAFVHDEGVIHRDLKPENLICRSRDRSIVLIDFGAVKTIEDQLNPNRCTQSIPVYTMGYAASEQCLGRPQFNSDLYSLGIIAIQCLTGTHPTFLEADPRTGDLRWEDQVQASPELIAILKRMTQYQSVNRYATAQDALNAIKQLRTSFKACTALALVSSIDDDRTQLSPLAVAPASLAPTSLAPTSPSPNPAFPTSASPTAPEPSRSRIKPWHLVSSLTTAACIGTAATLGQAGLFPNLPVHLSILGKSFGTAKAPSVGADLPVSQGDRLMLPQFTSPEKQAALGEKPSPNALKLARQSLPSDPETQIYLNNAIAQDAATIAVVFPFQAFPQASTDLLRGIAQAQTELNRSGPDIKIVLADDENQPDRARDLAKQLSEHPQVLGVIGHGSSDTTLAAAQVYQAQQLVTLAPISSATTLSGISPYLFRTMPSDRLPARALSQYLSDRLKKRRAAVLFSSKSAYSQSLKTEFKNALFYQNDNAVGGTDAGSSRSGSAKPADQTGAQIVTEIDLNQPDFSAAQAIAQARAKQADVLILATSPSDIDRALLVLQLNRDRLPVLAGDAFYSTKVRQSFTPGNAPLVLAVPTQQASLIGSPFAQRAQALWQEPVTWRSALAYDATIALTRALSKADLKAPIAIARARTRQILASSSFQANGSIGAIRFSETGDPQEAIQLVELKQNPRTRQPEFMPLK